MLGKVGAKGQSWLVVGWVGRLCIGVQELCGQIVQTWAQVHTVVDELAHAVADVVVVWGHRLAAGLAFAKLAGVLVHVDAS